MTEHNRAPMTIQHAAQLALDVQDACNLSGVAQSFAQVTVALWAEANRLKEGTEWVNHHPIAVLFTSKMADLARADASYYAADQLCQEMAKGESA